MVVVMVRRMQGAKEVFRQVGLDWPLVFWSVE